MEAKWNALKASPTLNRVQNTKRSCTTTLAVGAAILGHLMESVLEVKTLAVSIRVLRGLLLALCM